MLGEFFRKLLYTVVSLTNSQRLFSLLVSPQNFLPKICAPRFAKGADISLEETQKILDGIPIIQGRGWTNYWMQVGENFENQKRYRAACMSYVMGAFPKEDSPEKVRVNELKRRSFKKWCDENNFPMMAKEIQTPEGYIRYYWYRPPQSGRAPVLFFVNGLEGSGEEIGFSLLRYAHEGLGFVTISVPGSEDYGSPMSTHSDRLLKYVIDDLEKQEWVDIKRLGMIGFSFGAYWTFIVAKTDPRVLYSLCNGIPLKNTLKGQGSVGLNPVIAHALCCIFNVGHPLFLLSTITQLVQRAESLLYRPSGPIMAIDGDKDTIVDPRDTELLGGVPGNRLILLKNDDHCGLFHYNRMIEIIVAWSKRNLGIRPKPHAHLDGHQTQYLPLAKG